MIFMRPVATRSARRSAQHRSRNGFATHRGDEQTTTSWACGQKEGFVATWEASRNSCQIIRFQSHGVAHGTAVLTSDVLEARGRSKVESWGEDDKLPLSLSVDMCTRQGCASQTSTSANVPKRDTRPPPSSQDDQAPQGSRPVALQAATSSNRRPVHATPSPLSQLTPWLH